MSVGEIFARLWSLVDKTRTRCVRFGSGMIALGENHERLKSLETFQIESAAAMSAALTGLSSVVTGQRETLGAHANVIVAHAEALGSMTPCLGCRTYVDVNGQYIRRVRTMTQAKKTIEGFVCGTCYSSQPKSFTVLPKVQPPPEPPKAEPAAETKEATS